MSIAPGDPRIPLTSHLFGFGPMLPLVAAGIGAWAMPEPWPSRAIRLAIAWAALVLAFIGGVRRGFGSATRSPRPRPRSSRPRSMLR